MKIDDTTWAVLNEKSTAGYPRIHIVRWNKAQERFTCDCEHFRYRGINKLGFTCKHIRAVIKAYGIKVNGEGDPADISSYTATQKHKRKD